jgi:hypothetical protein
MRSVAQTQNADWSWDEHVLALDLYMSNPASPPGKGSKEVAELSRLLIEMGRQNGVAMTDKFRNVNGIYMKMMNFRRLDPAFQAQGKAGLSQGSKAELDVWQRFANDPEALHAAAAEIRRSISASRAAVSGDTEAGDLTPRMFDDALLRFRQLIAANDKGRDFTNFYEGVAAAWEDYKPRLRSYALEILQVEDWRKEQIGTGQILDRVIAAIEIQDARLNLTNNLVFWQNRYGHANRDHRALLEAKASLSQRIECEQLLFDLFRSDDNQGVFDGLAEFSGRKYPLLAYLYYLKDADRFMPIQPTAFDQAFRNLGIDLVTLRSCSWENYRAYNQALDNVRVALVEEGGLGKVRLVDAHSFCWLLEKLPAVPAATGRASRTNAGRIVGGREGAIIRMCLSIENTARNSNGQTVERTLKNKDLNLIRHELEEALRELMDLQENRCALTGIPFHYHGPNADEALLPSPDRIDSDGHYERGNLQVVCRFINSWKSATDNDEFKRLLELVRAGNG